MPLASNIGQQLTSMLTVTLSVYAVLRGLNAVISMAQGTELAIEPMGVGVTLTPGELLDPLNDMIEQVSSVLLVASASIGIQKIILDLSDIELFRWGLACISIIAIVLVALKSVSLTKQKSAIRLVLVLTLLRLIVPTMVLTSNMMQTWLESERQQSIAVLVSTENEVRALNKATADDQATGWFEKLTTKLNITNLFTLIKAKTDNAVTAAVYILAEFLLVFILIPLLFVGIAYKLLVERLSRRD
tara:strand:+ start:169890 stop:170624 length:735 start_codon:yes stop_codon:yes gene_type:complete